MKKDKGKTNFKGELFSYMNCNYFKNDICDIYARVLRLSDKIKYIHMCTIYIRIYILCTN